MMPKTTRMLLGAAVVLALSAMAQAHAKAGDPGARKKLYCWNQNGQRICSDTLPSEAVNQARDEINASNGMVSAAVDRQLTADERAAAAAAAAQAQADLAAEETRKRTDQAMLLSFHTEEELMRVFSDRTALIDNNVQTARYNVDSLRAGLVSLLRDAGDRELAGGVVPDKLAKDIQARHRELLWQQHLQASFERQRRELDGEIEQILQRYRAMKAGA